MRLFLATLGATFALLAGTAVPAAAQPTPPAQRVLQRALKQGLGKTGHQTGAIVVDLTTGQTLFSLAPNTGRLPASVEKLYTTSTALVEFGPTATLTTNIYGRGALAKNGSWHGRLYLKGGGDPSFGTASFDHANYDGGATIQRLVSTLITTSGIRSVSGQIVGDESYFDSVRGTPATGNANSPYLEGSLSALAFNRGLIDGGAEFVVHPAIFAASELASTLRAAHVNVPAKTPISAAKTPAGARLLATVHSPDIAHLIGLTNTPSDNFFAEMLLKGIGARLGAGGTTAAGAAVVRNTMAGTFHIDPTMDDGSGLSRDDHTSPRQVVSLLRQLAKDPYFVDSLAIAGETGTLQDEMLGTYAVGRCRGKTGTLNDVANLVGYCHARDGHTLAFAFLFNGLSDPDFGHDVAADMAVAVANYNG
jgi:serine-type D-Ala-D-Ala carboxypeptidase/endopeptidase (penicillin-binding protein 4)